MENASELCGELVWCDFRKQLGNGEQGKDSNPLHHEDGSGAKCKCIFCVRKRQGTLLSKSMVSEAKEAIETGQLRLVYERLREVRGIGPKIASFFLRDVADWFSSKGELTLNDNDDRHLLQPIDGRVEDAVKSLRQLLGEAGELQREGFQQWILKRSLSLPANAERVNQGMWYFGAEVAKSRQQVDKALRDDSYARWLLQDHVDGLPRHLDALGRVFQGWRGKDKRLTISYE